MRRANKGKKRKRFTVEMQGQLRDNYAHIENSLMQANVPEPAPAEPETPKFQEAEPQPPVVIVRHELSTKQRQRLRGRAAAARWRSRTFMECAGKCHVFWGTKGIRASYLRREFAPLMSLGDMFIEEDIFQCGQVLQGLPVCQPEVLAQIQGKFIIIVLAWDYARIRELLIGYGYIENVDFVEGRQLLGEDENGFIDLPCLEKSRAGMIVYGMGAHLQDMLGWHPELAAHITHVLDKDINKLGAPAPGTGGLVEPVDVLRHLPAGTEIAVAAIRYMEEIKREVYALNPGLICRNIDEIWEEYV